MRCGFVAPKGFPTYYRRSCLEIVLLGSIRFCCGALALPTFGLGETLRDRCMRAQRISRLAAPRRVPSVGVRRETGTINGVE
jgi:biotin synthase-like enzyme